ncbi:MAG: hypothetical protein NTZ74_08205 [Chloroflexi bacterium]|nr:hypothetical protein [Chloroflexota bacterium]
MKCINCGFENPESNKFCGNCGKKILLKSNKRKVEYIAEFQQETSKNVEKSDSSSHSQTSDIAKIKPGIGTNNNNGKRIKFVIVVLILLFILSVGIFLGKYYIPYNKAQKYISSAQYELAINELSRLGEYRDSQNLILESKFQWAIEELNSKDYQKAVDNFSSLDNYQDAKNYLFEAKYLMAIQLIAEKKYKDAIVIFGELENYKESLQQKTEANFLLAMQYVAEQKLAEAEKIFVELGNYKNSSLQLSETRYMQATNEIKASHYSNAIVILKKIVDYKDSNELITGSKYNIAVGEYKKGNFKSAKDIFAEIPNYKDSTIYIGKLNVLIGIQGTWEDEYGITQYVFSGWKYYHVFYPNKSNTSVSEHDLSENSVNSNSISFLDNGGTSNLLYKVGGYVLEDYWGETVSSTYRKLNNNTTPVAEKPTPRIGMTADQVRNSSWGSPEDINKTTTASSVSEQWVYPNYRYIYLENGIVTAIQD